MTANGTSPTPVTFHWLGIPMPIWNLISATIIAIAIGYFQYRNAAAITESSEKAADHSKALTAAVKENTEVAKETAEATQAIPKAAAIAADKIVEAKVVQIKPPPE